MRQLVVTCITLVVVAAPALPATSPSEADLQAAAHVLGRLGYGARPGDVERVAHRGVAQWIDQQLHPERVAEPSLDDRLAGLETVHLATGELLAGYNVPRDARREIQRRRAELGDNPSEAELQQLRREMRRELGGRMEGSPRQVLVELQAAKLIRAVHAERQLDEMLVDFWLNHFNVYADKGPIRFAIAEYERDVIRPHAWGRFEDLLLATAQSPAMLFYLDNWLSVDPEAAAQRQQRQQRRARRGRSERPDDQGPRRSGLNENYARELLELHTLGVDGGYTQRDVTELARTLTGWTIQGLRQGEPEFFFDREAHDDGEKQILGQRVKAGGVEEGEQMLRALAQHTSTARFVSTKLARRFVADDPPEALVERASATFLRTRGDIRAVLAELVTSPEFFSEPVRGAKVKTPLEYVASAVRAVGGEVRDARGLVSTVAKMGMPLYLQAPPTGYPDRAEDWVSADAMLERIDFAMQLARAAIPGVSIDSEALRQSTDTEALVAALVPRGIGATTKAALEDQGGIAVETAAMLLGSPEFQRR